MLASCIFDPSAYFTLLLNTARLLLCITMPQLQLFGTSIVTWTGYSIEQLWLDRGCRNNRKSAGTRQIDCTGPGARNNAIFAGIVTLAYFHAIQNFKKKKRVRREKCLFVYNAITKGKGKW